MFSWNKNHLIDLLQKSIEKYLPSWHLRAQSQQQKNYKKLWNIFKVIKVNSNCYC